MEVVQEQNILQLKILKTENGYTYHAEDTIVVEEPLEIRIQYFSHNKWQKKSLAVTMRTPGNDEILALGFLFSEGIIAQISDVETITQLTTNVLLIRLLDHVVLDVDSIDRNFYVTSSCGVCGKASIEKLTKTSCFFPKANLPKINSQTLQSLPTVLRNAQTIFDETGGIHAAGLFSASGDLIALEEDVGRHNAVDKLIGACLQKGMIPLRQQILMLSGRVSFELVQKTMMAGIPIIAAVGAPSSLAIELAEESGITLIGFLREQRFNVYCGMERLEE